MGAISSLNLPLLGFARKPDEILKLDRHRRREQRHLDQLSHSRLARSNKSGEDSRREQEASREIGNGDASRANGHAVARRSVCGEQSRTSLSNQVVRGSPGERTDPAVRADEADDRGWMQGMYGVPVEPETGRPLGWKVVQDDVRRTNQPPARAATALGLEVEDYRAFSAIEGHEVPTETRSYRQHVAICVPGGRLHLDHVRAQIGEKDAAERACNVLRILDDAHAFERQGHRSPSPRRAITSWRISAEPPEIVEPTDAR